MNLEPGTRLGPYEIVAPIGAGGMGEVYRARDSRLERMVAIKILPRQFAADARLRLRFEREAKVISALNHPHICAVYDVGQSGGNNPVSYIVMEYVDGETLAAILARGPLPVDEAIRFALQIAGALDKAHRQGIVHRDLKPANVMITRSGAKLLDFGLARSSDNAPVTESRGTDVMTEQGQVMGTLQYMAPEQLEGKQADGRADIFAFGAVVYEMLTGKRAFDRETRGGVMTAILSGDVRAPSAERTEVPAALDQIVLLCLTKSADERWQSAHDLKLALESLTGVAPARREGIRTRRWPWLALGTALIAAAFFGGRAMRGVKPVDAVRFEIVPPGGAPFTPTENSSSTLQFAVAPNGRLIVFVAGAAAGPGKLWLRTVDDVEAHPMEGTSGATFPFWSPDSRSVGFFADRKLKIAALSGGAPEALADAPDSRGGAWAPDGTILFAPSLAGPLYRVAATGGGNATPATNLDRSRGERGHRWPQFFPHSSRFLFLNMCGRVEDQGIYVGSLDSPDRQMLLKSNLRAEFAAGHLFFLRGGTLWAQALDPAALKLIGQPFQVAQGVGYAAGVRYGSFSVSDAATLAYVVAPGGAIRRLQWFDRKGQPMASITQPADWRVSSVSSDDQKVLASNNDPVTGNRVVFLLDAVRGTGSRLSYSTVDEFGAYWSPDGTQIAFNSVRAGLPDAYLKSATGRGSDAPLVRAEGAAFISDWSAHYIAFHDRAQGTGNDLWILPMSPRGQPSPFLRTTYSESQGMISPDERWIAYTSDESGHSEIYVQPFPSGGEKVRVSADGGISPSWRRDGKELFFISPVLGGMMSAPVRAAGRFEAGEPRELFRIPRPLVSSIIYPTYVPSSDGQRFLIVVASEPPRPMTITAALNWKPTQ